MALAASGVWAQSSKLSPELTALNPRSTAKVIVQWKNAPAITMGSLVVGGENIDVDQLPIKVA